MNTRPTHRIIRLATRDGIAVQPTPSATPEGPEQTLFVSFEGLTRAEQERALAGFPGGQRFVLVQKAS